MLKIRMLVVGSTRSAFLREGEAFYMKRIRPYARMEWVEVKGARPGRGKDLRGVLKAEGAALRARLPERGHWIALDRKGRMCDSEGFAQRLQSWQLHNERPAFVIGGPWGLGPDVLEAVHEVLSLSPMTFTHEMTRLILLEQIYRAFTILRGEPYHH